MSIRTLVLDNGENIDWEIDHQKAIVWPDNGTRICFALTNVAINQITSEVACLELAEKFAIKLVLAPSLYKYFYKFEFTGRKRGPRGVVYFFSMFPRDSSKEVDLFMAMAAAYGIGEYIGSRLLTT